MATTTAAIVDEALSAVALEITDAVQTMTLIEPTDGGYSTVTATYATGEVNHGSVRVVFDNGPVTREFEDFVAQSDPADALVFIESTTTPPEKNWILRSGDDYKLQEVRDAVVGSGVAYWAVARRVRT